jgi:hypothetical protein
VDGIFNEDASTTGIYTFENVTTNHIITAFFAKKTYQITTTAGAGGYITPENPIVEHGGSVTLNFVPQTGYKVNTVLIDGVANPAAVLASFYTFTNVTQAHTVAVTFTKMTFTITATHNAGGSITPSGVATVEYGDNSEIYIFDAEEGYLLQSVIIDGTNNLQAVYEGEYRFMNVTTNHTIHAIFVPGNFIITATATAGGNIAPAGVIIVTAGAEKTFYFEADQGYELTYVIIDGINNEEAVAEGAYTFSNIFANHNIAAQFAKKTYQITTIAGDFGYITPENPIVEHGGSVTLNFIPQTGYKVNTVLIDGVANPAAVLASFYTFNNITQTHTMEVTFVKITFTITATHSTGGSITPSGVVTVEYGEYETFEITPNDNYVIDRVEIDGVSEGAIESYTFYNVKANATIRAYFKVKVGIYENEEETITVFSHQNVVTIINNKLVPVQQVEILDMYGRIVWSGQAPHAKTEITLNVATGIYAVRIITNDNQNLTTKVIVN